MQFLGLMALVAGYGAVYTAAQMLKRPGGSTSGSVLYWITGIDSLGAPKGGTSPGRSSGTASGGGSAASNQSGTGSARQSNMPTGRGTHSP